jgi:hypothetical protein
MARIFLASQNSANDSAAADAENIASDRMQLDAGILEKLMNAYESGCALPPALRGNAPGRATGASGVMARNYAG